MKIQIEINWQPFVAATESAAKIIADAIRAADPLEAAAAPSESRKDESPMETTSEEGLILAEVDYIPGMRSFGRNEVRVTNLALSVAHHVGLTFREISDYIEDYSRYFRNSNGRGRVVSSEDATKIRLELIKKIKAKAVK